jgi:hypothetical protein
MLSINAHRAAKPQKTILLRHNRADFHRLAFCVTDCRTLRHRILVSSMPSALTACDAFHSYSLGWFGNIPGPAKPVGSWSVDCNCCRCLCWTCVRLRRSQEAKAIGSVRKRQSEHRMDAWRRKFSGPSSSFSDWSRMSCSRCGGRWWQLFLSPMPVGGSPIGVIGLVEP